MAICVIAKAAASRSDPGGAARALAMLVMAVARAVAVDGASATWHSAKGLGESGNDGSHGGCGDRYLRGWRSDGGGTSGSSGGCYG